MKLIAKVAKRFVSKNAANDKKQTTDVQVGLNVEAKAKMDNYNKSLGEAFGIDSGKVQPFLAPRTNNGDIIIMKCHMKAREVIKKLNPNIKVGITMSLYDNQALPGGEEYVKEAQEEEFLHYLPYIQEDDFFGVQNYTRKLHGPNGVVRPDENTRLTEAGNEFYPESLAGVIRFVSKYWKKPIIVTENGVSASDDKDRVEFIEKMIPALYQCVEEGINVIGYMHWSLMDNYEWQLGFKPKFGLIAVDRTTQTRYPKESLTVLGNISKYGF